MENGNDNKKKINPILLVVGIVLCFVNPAILLFAVLGYAANRIKRGGKEAVTEQLRRTLDSKRSDNTPPAAPVSAKSRAKQEEWQTEPYPVQPNWEVPQKKEKSRRHVHDGCDHLEDLTYASGFQEAYYAAKEKGQEVEPWELPPEKSPWEL